MYVDRMIIAVAAAALVGGVVQAQEFGDRQKGRALARQVCAECHAVGNRRLRSPNTQSPTFAAIAATPGMTATALNVFLHTSHRNMPNIILSADQTSDIAAYILSLKK
ncbi:MAG TPA: cytochrome c [Xanthobacteraceae bacterium]|jgi:mono/diheme cytochrome c family protein|nr:cytochrome c [Xanthobacteraceae bacterium]